MGMCLCVLLCIRMYMYVSNIYEWRVFVCMCLGDRFMIYSIIMHTHVVI